MIEAILHVVIASQTVAPAKSKVIMANAAFVCSGVIEILSLYVFKA